MRNPKPAKVGVSSGLPGVVWALLALLCFASILFFFARGSSRPFPSIESTLPSGTAVLAELLRRDGFDVAIDTDDRPRLPKDVVAIAYSVPRGFFSSPDEPTLDALDKWVAEGGTLIGMNLSADFDRASKGATVSEVTNDEFATRRLKQRVTIELSRTDMATNSSLGMFPLDGRSSVPVRFVSGDWHFVVASDSGKGVIVEVGDALGSTNRFIDKEQNAAFYVDLIRAVAPGKKVVFVEALFGNTREVGLLARLGSWANAAWWQFLLLALVVVFTLGKRFGLPERDRRAQRGARELVDAFADTMNRGKQRELALELIAADVELRLRRILSLDVGADERELLGNLPNELAQALVLAKRPPEKVGPGEATRIGSRLVALCEQFESERRRAGPGTRPIR